MFKFQVMLLTTAVVISSQAQANFVKYKKYYIPINLNQDCGKIPIPDVSLNSVNKAELAGDNRPRIFITTDIGGGDPDDKQSLVHLLSFSEKFKILGFGTSGSGSGSVASELQSEIIKQYIQKYQALSSKPGAADLSYLLDIDPIMGKDAITLGSQGRATPSSSKSNESSDAIIRHARCTYHKDGGKPLYVLNWGSSTDVMRALEDAKDIRQVVRVVSYSNYNNSPSQDRWFDHSAQSNVWRVEYRGDTLPLKNCSQSVMNALSANPLGKFILTGTSQLGGIVFNGRGDNAEGGEPGCGSLNRWTKLGDTITTAFVMRSAAQRNNPASSATFGKYDHQRGTYWKLRDESYEGKTFLYQSWINK